MALRSWPEAVYAVGDVHGCYDLLLQLEAAIVADAASISGDKLIVMVGDYVDRGPRSASVLDHLSGPAPAGFERICLVGNHEAMMLRFAASPSRRNLWLDNGGIETLMSYGMRADDLQEASQRSLRTLIDFHLPSEHLEFLRGLALTLSLPGAIFVHAGVRDGVPLAQQTEHDLLWSRPSPELGHGDVLVVHGHTPATEPVVTPTRICIDTGAFATGVLSAVRLAQGKAPAIITTRDQLNAAK